jgi:hypothetical protein
LRANAESQHRDIPVGIFSHSLIDKYLVICRMLWKYIRFPFSNASPKKKSELSPAREKSTLLTHHSQPSLTDV